MPNFVSNLFTRGRASSRASEYTYDANLDISEEPATDSKSFLAIPSTRTHRRSSSASSRSSGHSTSSKRSVGHPSDPPTYQVATSSESTGNYGLDKKSRQNSEYYRTPLRKESFEDALEILGKFDIVIVVDDSGSMQGPSWEEAREALSKIGDTATKFDQDGIDIHFLNSPQAGRNVKSSQEVCALFNSVRPRGTTPLGFKLDELLRDYLDEIEAAKPNKRALKKIKPINLIVITDGRPSDDIESVIVDAAKRLDKGNFPLAQVGIQLVQIGQSEKVGRYLRKLDDSLVDQYQIRDIVDTTPYFGILTGDSLIKVMVGGINRKIDHTKA